MLEVYKPHTNREAVGVWLCSAAKRPSKQSALVIDKDSNLNSINSECEPFLLSFTKGDKQFY